MNVHVLQHVAFEGLGSIEAWLRERGAVISYTKFFEAANFPVIDIIDLVIALGGPMSVNDEDELPWLRAEKAFIRAAAERDIPILGICLGAQLIASAFGARVYPNRAKEIGWFPVHAVATHGDAFQFPKTTDAFHWHGETFELPPAAILLASSVACAHQAFQIGRNIIGLQFHLETTPAAADAILQHCADELIEGAYIQSATSIQAASADQYAAINQLMAAILHYLTSA